MKAHKDVTELQKELEKETELLLNELTLAKEMRQQLKEIKVKQEEAKIKKWKIVRQLSKTADKLKIKKMEISKQKAQEKINEQLKTLKNVNKNIKRLATLHF